MSVRNNQEEENRLLQFMEEVCGEVFGTSISLRSELEEVSIQPDEQKQAQDSRKRKTKHTFESTITQPNKQERVQNRRYSSKYTLEETLIHFQPLAIKMAQYYSGRGLDRQDIEAFANWGIIKAYAKYADSITTSSFSSYVVLWIRQVILDAIHGYSGLVRIPANVYCDSRLLKFKITKLTQQLGREVSLSEVAERFLLPIEKVEKLLSYGDPPVYLEPEELEDLWDADASLPDKQLMDESLSIDIDFALNQLSRTENAMLRLYYGIGRPREMTMEEIALRFGLSKERIRQIVQRGLERLTRDFITRRLICYL